MSTIVYRNARLFVDGADVAAQLNELSLEYSAEILDETCFGDDTRVRKGGLKQASASGKGFFDSALDADAVLFNNNGTDDVVFTLFPDGITLGSQCGYAMKATLSEFHIGEGGVGAILGLSFAAESRGL